jgi:hypothetical protein
MSTQSDSCHHTVLVKFVKLTNYLYHSPTKIKLAFNPVYVVSLPGTKGRYNEVAEYTLTMMMKSGLLELFNLQS